MPSAIILRHFAKEELLRVIYEVKNSKHLLLQKATCNLLDNECSLSLADLVEYCQRKFGKIVSSFTIYRVLKDFHFEIKRTHHILEACVSPIVYEERIIC